MDKKKGIIVLLIAAVAILYFGGFLGGDTCTVEADDHVCAESTLEGCDGYVEPCADDCAKECCAEVTTEETTEAK